MNKFLKIKSNPLKVFRKNQFKNLRLKLNFVRHQLEIIILEGLKASDFSSLFKLIK